MHCGPPFSAEHGSALSEAREQRLCKKWCHANYADFRLQHSAPPLQVMAGAEGASDVARPGCGLGGNLDVAVCRAEWLFHQGACQARIL